ncbi:MAG: type II toxin-antitoxin system VapC family toxin [Chloroflexi bacterium]|nr:type II toxin-antitoxin system VapC family toxin [Chloroflexota bacterium]
MNIVVDASVIVAVIANESEKDVLIRMTQGADLIAPNSIHWEIGNAFSAMLKRKRITLAQAQKAIEIYQSISINFVDVDIRESLKIADELGIYAYDAYLLQCAIKFASPLISLDRALLTHARQKRIQVMEVAE